MSKAGQWEGLRMKLVYSSIALSAIAYNVQYTALQECIMMSYSVKMMSS